MKEISDPIFRSENPALLEELKANDIRNSVLWTGKVIEKLEEDEVKVSEGKDDGTIVKEVEKDDKTTPISTDLPADTTILVESEKQDEINIKHDQSIPQNPILNPNLKKVMPSQTMNMNQTQQPKDVYYHTYNNPYVFQNPVFNMMTNRQPYYSIYFIFIRS